MPVDGKGRLSMVVIGTEGAGKTVYLASLHSLLFSDYERRGYTIFTSLLTRNRLNAVTRAVERPGVDWPRSTTQISTYNFTCRVQTANREIDLFDLQYTDYPGQLLVETVDGTEQMVEQLQEAFRTADVVLTLVDGRQILAMLRDEQPLNGIDYVGERLQPIFQQALEQRLTCSVHLVITKWDLLHAAGFDLVQVREKLLSIDFVRGLIESRSRDDSQLRSGGIRLIPVSAVGFGYAEPRFENGVEVMVKRSGRRPVPVNIDVPFAAILPDKVRQALASMTTRELKQARKRLRKLRRRQLGNATARVVRMGTWFATPLTKLLGVLFPGGQAGASMVITLLDRVVHAYQKIPSVTAGELDDALRDVKGLVTIASEAEQVMSGLLTTFELRIKVFEDSFPGWDLWSPAVDGAGVGQ